MTGEMMTTAQLVSVQTGRVQTHGDLHQSSRAAGPWETAFYKTPVSDPVTVGPEGIVGDEVADTIHHGGVDKAVLCYSLDHRTAWAEDLPDLDTSPGAFGENLSVSGIDETTVCIGDRWQVGSVVLEVSQPRQPCWKLGRRHDQPDLPKRVVRNGRSGWYVRVLEPGVLSGHQSVTLTDRPHPEWTVARTAATFYDKTTPADILNELASLGPLAQVWKDALQG